MIFLIGVNMSCIYISLRAASLGFEGKFYPKLVFLAICQHVD